MAHQEGLVSRHINRRVSRPIARGLLRTPITPNQVTVASFVIALIAAALFLLQSNVWGGVLTQLSSIVDGVDGDLARLRGSESRFGGFLDAVLDRYSDVAILAGLTYSAAVHEELSAHMLVWLVGLLAVSGSLIVSYTRARGEATLQGSFSGWAFSLASRDIRLFVIMLGSLLGLLWETLLVVALLSHVAVVGRLIQSRSLAGSPQDAEKGSK